MVSYVIFGQVPSMPELEKQEMAYILNEDHIKLESLGKTKQNIFTLY